MEPARFALGTVPESEEILRSRIFLVECIAERSLRGSMVEDSESDEPAEADVLIGGLFSSTASSRITCCTEDGGVASLGACCGGDMFAVRATSSERSGEVRSSLSDEDARFSERVGARGEPSECEGPRDDLDRKPAWNLLGFAAGKFVTSGISRLGLESDVESAVWR